MISVITGRCEFPDCDQAAVVIAVMTRNPLPGQERFTVPACYCFVHGLEVADMGSPEYSHECKNCGCLQGVN